MFQGGRITKALLEDLKPQSVKREEKLDKIFKRNWIYKLIDKWKKSR
jgi:hypothetical protein